MSRTGLIPVVLVAATVLAQAQPSAAPADSARFSVPPGWQRAEKGDMTLLVPPDVPKGKTAVLLVMPGQTVQTGLRAWFDGQWAEVKRGTTVTEAGEVVAGTAAAGYEFIYTAATLQDADNKSFFAFFFAARSGGLAQTFLYMADDQALVAAHTEALKAFLGSLTFADAQPQAPPGPPAGPATSATAQLSPSFTWGQVPPAKGAAGLSGTYHMQDLGAEVSVISGLAVTNISHTYWTFFPDGRCYYSMPDEGFENFNYDYLAKMNATWCCTYKMEGDNGIISWGDAQKSTLGFKRVGKGLTIKRDLDHYKLLDPCNGLKLDGTFKRYDWEAEYSPKEGITFTPDGRFVDQGFLHGCMTMWWYSDRKYVDAQSLPGSGTYRVANNSLELIYADGRKLRLSFQLADEVSKEHVTAFLIRTYRYVLAK